MELLTQIQHETIFGGVTRDTLQDVYRMLGDALPLCQLMNHVTLAAIGKFMGPTSTRQDLMEKDMITLTLEGVTTHVVKKRTLIPDDQLRVFASDGRLFIITFQ